MMSLDELTKKNFDESGARPVRDADRQGDSGGNSGGRRPGSLYWRVIASGFLAGVLYYGYQVTERLVTDLRIARVRVYDGKEAANRYALQLWEETYPGREETFLRNAFHPGKREALLKYFGYRKLEEMKSGENQQPTTPTKSQKDSL